MRVLFQAMMMVVLLTLIGGVMYPAVVTVIGQALWPEESNGSLVKVNDTIVGSALLAQSFKQPKYFWPRPSASNYGTLPSGASNLGPTSAELLKQIAERRRSLSAANPNAPSSIPIDALTASASGLDPHISLQSATMQVERVGRARGLSDSKKVDLMALINNHYENRQLRIFGEPRINVLLLNLELDIWSHIPQG